MNPDNNWYEDVEKKIIFLKEKIGKKDYQKYKLDYLQLVAHKVASLSPECSECHSNQENISKMLSKVIHFRQMTKEQMKGYFHTFRSVVGHLESHVGESMMDIPMPRLIGAILLTFIFFAIGHIIYTPLNMAFNASYPRSGFLEVVVALICYMGFPSIPLIVLFFTSKRKVDSGKGLVPITWECEECGAEIVESDKVCPKCGVEFEEE